MYTYRFKSTISFFQNGRRRCYSSLDGSQVSVCWLADSYHLSVNMRLLIVDLEKDMLMTIILTQKVSVLAKEDHAQIGMCELVSFSNDDEF